MYTENYSPEEINRIKKIIEIGESQKQIKHRCTRGTNEIK